MNPVFFWTVLGLQVGTYVALGLAFIHNGQWRFGVVQLLLAAVQGLIYSMGAP